MTERCNCDASCGENRYHDLGEPGCRHHDPFVWQARHDQKKAVYPGCVRGIMHCLDMGCTCPGRTPSEEFVQARAAVLRKEDEARRNRFRAEPCGCGARSCWHWHVSPVAAFQGVSFTEEQARAVAEFMNSREWKT